MSQRETMKLLAAQEAAQWAEEGQASPESRSGPLEQLAEMSQQMKELDARQARIENHLIKLAESLKGLLEVNPPKHLAGTAPFTPPGAGPTAYAAAPAGTAGAIPFSAGSTLAAPTERHVGSFTGARAGFWACNDLIHSSVGSA